MEGAVPGCSGILLDRGNAEPRIQSYRKTCTQKNLLEELTKCMPAILKMPPGDLPAPGPHMIEDDLPLFS